MSQSGARKVELFDTSLRDGLQQPNLEISVPMAVKLLERLDAFGFHYAEVGFAGANKFVTDLTTALEGASVSAMKMALFGRTRGRGMKVGDWSDVQFILERKRLFPAAVIVIKSRLLDVTHSLETTPEENLLMAYETIAALQDQGLEVLVDLEHGLDAFCGRREKGEPCDNDFAQRTREYFFKVAEQCVQQKVSRIVVCDTTGGGDPEEAAQAIGSLVAHFPKTCFGFHGHTDRGFGVANTRAAILAGARHVQGTLLGTGERCGNVNLTTLIGSMQLRGEAEFVSEEQLKGLASLARFGYEAFSLDRPHSAPIAGAGAFGTWAGMHGSSERKNPGAYLWTDPARVGASAVVGVNAQSGRANIMMLSEEMGAALDSVQAQALIDANQAMIDGGGFTASETSFRLACMRVLKTLPEWFTIRSWRVIDESDEAGKRYVQAAIALSLPDATVATARAEGAGPVDALTKAMRLELEKRYPALIQMRLGRFSVAALDVSIHDTAAYVRVTVSFHAEGHDSWTTAGVSGDLNQAALMAIVDGFDYWLLKNLGPQ
jgi:2-isopropylmalate synthase